MIKDILVYLEGNGEDKVRLAYGELIAGSHRAFLTGIYLNFLPDTIYVSGGGVLPMGNAISSMQEKAMNDGDEVEKKLTKQLDKLDLNSELRRLDLTYAQAAFELTKEARAADFMIATRPYNHETASPELLEAVLFNSGRGCLFVPPAIKPNGAIDKIVLAWKNTEETARAVSNAMPLMVAAGKVVIAIVDEKSKNKNKELVAMPAADIARHLNRHGIDVEISHIDGFSNVSEALLNEVEKVNAKMLVMGGYGHSRFREWVMGGATRDVLSDAQIPVFISH